jgi:hypothetical protein
MYRPRNQEGQHLITGVEVGAAGRSRRESFGRPRGMDAGPAVVESDSGEAVRERGFQVMHEIQGGV